LIDASDPFTIEDQKIYKTIIGDKRLILVINKIDLVEDDFKPEIPETWEKIPSVKISALYGNGLSSLKDLIAKLAVGDHQLEVQNTIIPNLRHKIAFEKSLEFAISASEELRKGTSFELIAIDIKETLDKLGEIVGAVVKEDVIDQIFSRFCIGK